MGRAGLSALYWPSAAGYAHTAVLALEYRNFGRPSEVLQLVERPMPEAVPGFTLVEMLARPINPMDLLMIRGLYPLKPELPGIPGAEGVGRVIAADPASPGAAEGGSAALQPGTLVLLPIRHGSWCSHTLVPTKALLPLDSGLDPAQACMLRVNPTTAHLLLEQAQLEPGDVFVHGPGSGSVGQLLTQLGKARGLNSIAVVRRAEAAAELQALGANEVLVEGPDLAKELRRSARRLGKPIKVAFDGVGGSFTQALAASLEERGKVVCYGAMSRKAPGLQVSDCVFRGIRLEGFWLLDWRRQVGQAEEDTVVRQLSQAGLRSKIAGRFGLAGFKDALKLAESGSGLGRVILS